MSNNNPWLIVGLGNPGSKYYLTRHNIGFLAVDALAKTLGAGSWNDKFKAEFIQLKWLDRVTKSEAQVILAKPQTFMNLSGESVQPIMHFYKVPQEQLIVLQDDIDQPFQSMRFHKNRGHGGHNGIRDISAKLGSADYIRLKLGVGRPPHPEMEVADYVLQKFSEAEQSELPQYLKKAGDAIETLIFSGFGKASSLYNK